MPNTRNHQQNTGAGDFSREGLTGDKFGMKILTRIGGSCLSLPQSPADQNNVNINEEK
jgi:hypothetical protein